MDEADVVAYTTLTDQYLKKFGNFVEHHFCTLVRSISEESHGENSSSGGGSTRLGSSGDYNSFPNGGSYDSSSSISNVTLHSSSNYIWDQILHPIRIHWSPTHESQSFEELTCIPHPLDGNPDVQKVMLVLVTITSQARSLKETGDKAFVNPIVLYGDYYETEGGANASGSCGGEDHHHKELAETEGEGHLTISKLIPLLLDLLEYIQACTDFVNHWISQISALFKETKPHVVSITNLQLHSVFREFSDLLAFLVILDEIIRNQSVLQEHWLKYRQMIKSVRADSRSFNTDHGNLLQLERELLQIDKYIMSAHIFRNFIDTVLQQNQRLLTRNYLLADKFLNFVTTLAGDLDKTDMIIMDVHQDYRHISLAAIYVFAASLFPTCFDPKKVFQKIVWEPLKRVTAVALPGSNIWIPEIFLNTCVQGNGGKLFDNRAIQTLAVARTALLQQKVAALSKDIFSWNLQFSSWTVRLQEVLYIKDLSVISMADLSRKCTLLVEGTKLAQILNHTFKLILNLHASLGRPIGKHVVVQLCQLLELLKSIEGVFFQFSVRLCCSTMYILQYVMHTAFLNVRAAQRSILGMADLNSRGGRVDENKADALSVLKILEHCLRGNLSKKRLLVAQIALDWVVSSNSTSKLWKDDDTSLILPAAFERISQLMNLEENVSRYCDGSSVYFHRVILSTYFSHLYANPQEASKLPMIFLIIRDCLTFLQGRGDQHHSIYAHGEHQQHQHHAEEAFMTEIKNYLRIHFVDRLCQDVETDLRILSHTHLQVETGSGGASDTNSSNSNPAPPFRAGVKSLEGFLEIPSFSLNNRSNLSLKAVVEHYLSKTYYNLASVALHDWQSYATMRVLAMDKYKLSILDDNLPGHSLEQGRDILEIVRNLPQFVVEFTYNLNNQVFVQVNSPNKHLDTVNIRHLANSLRTHGPGMANTTINFTYRFLRQKITSLSQFMYIEQVKSRLAKDIKMFKQSNQQEVSSSSTSASQRFAFASLLFERANKFKQGIRKLGVNTEGLSPLDQFRILITHIGNALGFVRLVRSGGSHHLAGGYQFVPDLQDLTQFGELIDNPVQAASNDSNQDNSSNDIRSAATGIDSAIKTLSTSFSDGIDYFKLLVNAFQPALLEPKNAHLKNFYGIIPALTLSYVDHMRLSKEKLAKRSKTPSIFTDDGFPMGVAYLLKVLNQGADFDSLSWFSNVEYYLLHERRTAIQAIHDSKKDEKLQQANTLTAKRLLDVLNEFQLVRYNLSSARIFFQHDIISPSSTKSTDNNTSD